MKKVVSLLLAVTMLTSLFPTIVFAAETPAGTIAIGEESVGERTSDQAKIYKLVVRAHTPNGFNQFALKLSYDNTVIVPVYKEAPYVDVGANYLESIGLLAKSYVYSNITQNYKENLFGNQTSLWKTIGNRTCMEIGASTLEAVYTGQDSRDLFEFYFRVTDESKLSKTTFRLEDTWTGDNTSFLYQYLPNVTTAYGTLLNDKVLGNLFYGKANGDADTISQTLTYTGSNKVTLGSLEVTAPETVHVPGTGSAAVNCTATAKDTDGDAMTTPSGIVWSIDGNQPTGVEINASTGEVTVDSTAQTGTVTVKATSGTVTATDTISIQRTGTVTVGGGQNTIAVPHVISITEPSSVSTSAFTAVVKDTANVDMTNPAITWSIKEATHDGVSIDATTGVVTVTNATAVDSVTVVGTYGGVSGEKSLSITKEAPVASFVAIQKNGGTVTSDTLTIPVANAADNETTYTAAVYDQFGAAMTGQNINWTLATADNYVTHANGVVTVKAGATPDKNYTLTASTGTAASASIDITVKDVVVNWDSWAAKTAITYGDSKESAFTSKSSTGTATAGGNTLNGTFEIVDRDTFLPAGNLQKIAVQFTVTDAGAYNGTKVTKDFMVNVDKKPVTVTMNNANKAYGEANPAFDFTVPNGALVGTDTKDALAVTPACVASVTSSAGTTVDITGTSAAANYDVTVTKGTLTITKAPLTITAATIADKTYNNTTTASVTAVTFNGLKNSETLELGTEKDFTATAAFTDVNAGENKPVNVTVTLKDTAKANNYTLSNNTFATTKTVAKADRNLTLTVTNTVLTIGQLTAKAAATTDTNLDNSAVVTYSSDSLNVTVNSKTGDIAAIGNGSATVKATIAATTNYNAASKTVDMKAVAQPVIGAVAASTSATDQLTATVEGTTIKVRGFITATQKLTITPTGAAGVTVSPVEITGVDADKLTAGTSLTAKVAAVSGNIDVTYTVDAKGVTLLPPNMEIAETAPVVPDPVDNTIPPEVKQALENAATKTEGLAAALPASILTDAAEKVTEKATEIQGAFGSAPDAYKIKIDVKPEIKIEGYNVTPGAVVLSLDITPIAAITAVADTGATNPAAPPIPLGTKPVTTITAPVTVHVKLPAGFPTDKPLFVKHTLSNGHVEYLKAEVVGDIASFTTTSFSPFELIPDSRTGSIQYQYESGLVQTVTYDRTKLDTALPADSKAGRYRFDGWSIDGVTYATVTDALLTAVNGATKTATPVFAYLGSGGTTGGGSSVTTYTITATSGEGGTITPSGKTNVTSGANQTFTIAPKDGYVIADVLVDGKSIGAVSTYTFDKVKATHTISATFTEKKNDVADLFSDVATSAWYHDAVQYVYDNGLMKGTSEKTFAPDDTLSRGMIITMLYRMDKTPSVTGTSSFTDVTDSSAWYSDAVLWASQNGISKGYDNGAFGVNDNVTREQLAAFLYRYASWKGYDVSKSVDLSAFADAGHVASYAAPAVKWAVASQIINGMDGKLVPNGSATRAQAATMMMRFAEKLAK